jgi:hypothetical protein
MTEITLQSTIRAVKDQVSCDLEGEAVILSLNEGIYYTLNSVGARIWNLIREPLQVGMVCDIIVKEFDVAADKCERDVLQVLGEMEKEGLIVIE